jgi:hypothetical protein
MDNARIMAGNGTCTGCSRSRRKHMEPVLLLGRHQQTTFENIIPMPENGVIFSDGIESDFLQFNSGIEATISVAEKRGHLVV